MPRVNLLPWRDEIRKDRERRFYISLGVGAVVMLIIVGIVQFLVNGMIQDQKTRNGIITAEITRLNKQIKEIDELQAQKDALLARMNIIQSLQATRPLVVHLFDDLVRTLPEGVYTDSIHQTGDKLKIEGFAQSNARVSAFMRNIEASEWLTEPTLTVIRTADSGAVKSSQFTLLAKQVTPTSDDEEEQSSKPARGKGRRAR